MDDASVIEQLWEEYKQSGRRDLRDRLMAAEAECYPGYDFDSNRGYPSHRHRCALLGYGPTAIHRRSWIYMENLPWAQPAPALTLFS